MNTQSTSSVTQGVEPRKPVASTAPKQGTGQVTKRLQIELRGIMMSGIPSISAFPAGDNIFHWVAKMTGPESTPYEKQDYELAIKFGRNYPVEAPIIKFTTPIFHPNVDTAGNICLDILKEEWSPLLDVKTILMSLQSLLGDPNNASPLNIAAANMWANQTEFKKEAAKVHANGKTE